MKKQKVMSQKKGQGKIPEKHLNEVETGNLSEKELRIMIVKMIQLLRKTMKKIQEMFIKDLEELKNKQTEMNNILEGINSRITEAEEQMNDMEAGCGKSLMQNRTLRGEQWKEIKTA